MMAIKHIMDAALFFKNIRTAKPPTIKHSLSYLQLESGGSIPIHYYPARKSNPDSGWILFIHGMNYSGHDEPRIMNLCSVLAALGYNVLSPNIDSIANFWIDFNSITIIRDIISAIKKHPDWQINKKLGLMSISLTGTVAVHATADKKCAEQLSGILLFGSFCDSNKFISHVLSKQCTQPYPKLIVIKNLLQLAHKDSDLIQALHYYINDFYQKICVDSEKSECQQHLQKINRPEIKAELENIVENIHDTEHYNHDYADELKYIDDQFAKMDFPEQLPFPITLLHGEDDNTVSSSESIKLHEKLQSKELESNLLITPLIESHSHLKLSPTTLWEFFLLSKSMSKFLSKASA